MTRTICRCGHDLGHHPPTPSQPFAWPCKFCTCATYDAVEMTLEQKIPRAQHLKASGYKITYIAKQFGVDEDTVQSWLDLEEVSS